MVRIYFCDMTNFEHLYDDCLCFLTEKRKQKAERCINKNDALLSATVGLMLRKVLGVINDNMLLYGEHGKPFLEHGPCFSISHSRKYAVLAVSNNNIGVDIEMHETARESVMKRCFSEDEQDFAKLSTENFLRIWTAKEAVLKLLGTGFSFSPNYFSVLPFDEEHEINGTKIRFFCGFIGKAPLTAAYCGDENEFEIREFLPEDLLY